MLAIIDMFLNDDDLLNEKTKLFVDKCQTYCDKVHFPKVISELSKSNNKQIVNKLPYWYLRSFIIKSLRLFANKKSLKVLYKQFYQNILSYTKYSGFTYPLILIEAFFHLIFLQMKTIKNKIVK